jgi:hypothetical protein
MSSLMETNWAQNPKWNANRKTSLRFVEDVNAGRGVYGYVSSTVHVFSMKRGREFG